MPGADDPAPPPKLELDVVATAHLDTQWRWTIRETIDEYLPATLRENLAYFEKYPDYVFSFEGAFRYMLMREYYPSEYERMRRAIADGRWRVAGSWVDAVDTNIPSPESLIRQALYGNGYFEKEFGKRSRDVFLPDCFGFGYALPSIAAHCGLLGFSTQKLTWGSAYGVPFDIGIWEGVDGSALAAALRPGDYVGRITHDWSADSSAIAAIESQGKASGLYKGLRYFGTGDQGGSPAEESVAWLEKSLAGGGPILIRPAGSDDFAREIAQLPQQRRDALPRYRGELLMTDHGIGCYTSQAAMKRWNRKNERLADAAEKASVAADWLGAAPYPRATLNDAWIRFLWHQFHDDLTGTSIPEAYVYSWNDEAIASNLFRAVLADAAGGVARALDTRAKGIPVAVSYTHLR
ncbi:MAG: alpha-mannosidase, partial [Candidatus Eisenbacteria bacterium]|nr:alpha-mannosidase [Candidatus Eisenbacteria bacterium]